MGLSTKILYIFFICYLLLSIVICGILINAIFNSTDDGDKRCITLSSTALIMSKAALILYMIKIAIMGYLIIYLKIKITE
jgi:hypothetical protein